MHAIPRRHGTKSGGIGIRPAAGKPMQSIANPSSVSLIVTTNNWPQALALVLASASRQTRKPDEVIVADDGSGTDTATLLRAIATRYPVPLRHAWQEDLGFRAARSRNLAIAAASGEYVLLLDGDMVLHPRFIADHLAVAKRNAFVQGSRVLIAREFSERMLRDPALHPGFLSGGIQRRRHTLRVPLLSKLYLRARGDKPRMIKSCNQGWWRSDLLELNGFDERMLGWGREDDELAARAGYAGITCRQLRLSGLAFHLHHEERHSDGASCNDAYLAQTHAQRLTRCDSGIDGHLAEFRAHPLPDLRLQPAAQAASG
jgi:GT2 family glycosyltransferase